MGTTIHLKIAYSASLADIWREDELESVGIIVAEHDTVYPALPPLVQSAQAQ